MHIEAGLPFPLHTVVSVDGLLSAMIRMLSATVVAELHEPIKVLRHYTDIRSGREKPQTFASYRRSSVRQNVDFQGGG